MAEDKNNQYVAGKTESIIAPLRDHTGEKHTGYADNNAFATAVNESKRGISDFNVISSM